METSFDPFLLYEQQIDVDIHSVFKQEAFLLLTQAELEKTAVDELFEKVDNLLNVASDMLEYSLYLQLVSDVMNCGGHNHEFQERMRQSGHVEHSNHGHEDEPEEKKSKNKKITAVGRGLLFYVLQSPNKKPTNSIFEPLLGVK